mmetsp:Transcript_34728/g.75115  ORF Transcript_34728/g.75115 Transcript_34728/m.75115 type:complete len:218 (-) Transcript_34728:284-937(-)
MLNQTHLAVVQALELVVEGELELGPEGHVHVVHVRVEAGQPPPLHHQPVEVVDANHQQQADGVVNVLHPATQMLSDQVHHLAHRLLEDVVLPEELRAEDELTGARVQQELVDAAEDLLAAHSHPLRLCHVRHHRTLVKFRQDGAALAKLEALAVLGGARPTGPVRPRLVERAQLHLREEVGHAAEAAGHGRGGGGGRRRGPPLVRPDHVHPRRHLRL